MSAATMELETTPVPTPEILGGVSELEKWATGLVVTNQSEYEQATETVKGVKNWRGKIVAFFADSKQKAFAAHRAIVTSEKSMTDKLDAVETKVKRTLLTYSQEQERKRREEQARLQAEADERARKEREKAEQAAAKQRQIEAEARAKADAARAKAAAADEAERRALLAEADAAERKAAAANAKAEAKDEQADSAFAPVVLVASTVNKVAGMSTRTTWKHRIVDVTAVPRDWMQVNDTALAAFAKSTKGQVPVAGVEFYAEESLAIGGRG